MLLLTIATFAGGCGKAPHSRTTGTVITVIGTGPNNQTATVPLTIAVQKRGSFVRREFLTGARLRHEKFRRRQKREPRWLTLLPLLLLLRLFLHR